MADFETKLSDDEEPRFQDWKQKFAPRDSGFDYDLRGAFKKGLIPDKESGHWPDTFKKPNHPTFSDQSIYARDRPDLAGSWNGETFIPPKKMSDENQGGVDLAELAGVRQQPDWMSGALISAPPPMATREEESPGASGAQEASAGVPGLEIPGGMQEASSRLAGIQRAKIKTNEEIEQETAGRMDRDRTRAESALTGISSEGLKPWDFESEKAKRQTDPVEAFGSLGSVFAIIASSFTRQPMINALEGSAAAMMAMKDGNDKDYDRAYTAWKDNTTLALKRHEIQRESYNDAMKFLDTDMKIGTVKMQNAALKFGDQHTLALIETGNWKELVDVQHAREKNATELAQAQQKMELDHIKIQDLKQDPDWDQKNPTSEKSRAAYQRWQERQDPKLREQILRDREMSTYRQGQLENNRAKASTTNMSVPKKRLAAIEKAEQEFEEREGRKPNSEELNKINREAHKVSMNEYQQQKLARGDVEKEQKLDSVLNQIDRSLQLIKEVSARGGSVVGARGAIGRLGEFVMGTGTEQAEFEQIISTLKKEIPVMLRGSSKVMKDDLKELDKIVPGMGFFKNQEQAAEGLKTLKKILGKRDLVKPDADEVVPVETPEEARKLPPNTKFITPDGREGKTRGAETAQPEAE